VSEIISLWEKFSLIPTDGVYVIPRRPQADVAISGLNEPESIEIATEVSEIISASAEIISDTNIPAGN